MELTSQKDIEEVTQDLNSPQTSSTHDLKTSTTSTDVARKNAVVVLG
jgi:hypothetical protein